MNYKVQPAGIGFLGGALLFLASIWQPYLSGQDRVESLRESLRNRLEASHATLPLAVKSDRIHARETLYRYYQERVYLPLWTRTDSLSLAEELVQELGRSAEQGLSPLDYHLELIEELLRASRDRETAGRPPDLRQLVDLELLLTDTFLVYGAHLVSGRVNPETIDPEWIAARREVDLAELLKGVDQAGTVRAALRGLHPAHRGYRRLQRALAEYRGLADRGGWAPIPAGPKLESGLRDDRVRLLERRLGLTGDSSREGAEADDLFDGDLARSVRHFQQRHGLEPDGVVGPRTLAALNLSVEVRIHQIEMNLERWRWLPQELGGRHILVNIAGFELVVVEDEEVVLTMAVIAGKPYRRTPVFTGQMSHLVLSPYWHVPPRLAVQDLLPKIRQDPDYLVREGFKVFQGWGEVARELDPSTIDWNRRAESGFPYRFRQDPGARNALGRVKFMFPNKFNVYLHDTPQRELFARTERTFSSGCIRIERPLELAAYLLGPGSSWGVDRIREVADGGVERTVRLAHPIPVHLLYWTAWAEQDGSIHFRNDVYGRDQRLDQALHQRPPAPAPVSSLE